MKNLNGSYQGFNFILTLNKLVEGKWFLTGVACVGSSHEIILLPLEAYKFFILVYIMKIGVVELQIISFLHMINFFLRKTRS